MKREWEAARAKVDAEYRCRRCGMVAKLDAAHIIPRSRVPPGPGEDPKNIVPLCRPCHESYDRGEIDLLPYLTVVEQAYAVLLVGLEEARHRISGHAVQKQSAAALDVGTKARARQAMAGRDAPGQAA